MKAHVSCRLGFFRNFKTVALQFARNHHLEYQPRASSPSRILLLQPRCYADLFFFRRKTGKTCGLENSHTFPVSSHPILSSRETRARARTKNALTHLTSDRCTRRRTVHNISDSKSYVYTLSLGKSNIRVEYTYLLISFRSTRPRISRCILQRYRRL